jgi:hypothetical protein
LWATNCFACQLPVTLLFPSISDRAGETRIIAASTATGKNGKDQKKPEFGPILATTARHFIFKMNPNEWRMYP